MPTVYATAADVEADQGTDLYLYIADRDADGVADEAAVNASIARASSLVDGYVARYLVNGQLPVVPLWLHQAAIDLTVYDLVESPTESQTKKRDEAMQALRDVAAGRLLLGVPETDSQMESEMEVVACDQVFSRYSTAGIL